MEPVWSSIVGADSVSAGLAQGSYVVDVMELGEGTDAVDRFGTAIRPLFWVEEGEAHLIPDPQDHGPPRGDLAVVLRRRVAGLAGLVAHVEVVQEPSSNFDTVLRGLVESASRVYPDLPAEELVQGIEQRRVTMPAAVGSGVAIPHAYWDGLMKTRCFLAVVPSGVTDMVTPDGLTVHLVFLLISPLGLASEHLESLAAIGSLGQEQGFIDLLSRQRVPQRVAALLKERG